jgi:deoxycytidine triphosphate deaminase
MLAINNRSGGINMVMMHRDDIKRAMSEGYLTIDEFSDDHLQPASYNFRLGNEAITSSRRGKEDPSHKGLLTIPAGDFALVKTYERVKLSPSVAGHIGLRSHYSKKGLDLLAGPQIDPGFDGYLVVGLTNLSPRDITIPYKEEFCTVEFYKFSEPVSKPYDGEYQGQPEIMAKDLELLVDSQGMTFGEVIRSLGSLSSNVSDLSRWVKMLAWAVPAIVAVGIAVIGIIVAIK